MFAQLVARRARPHRIDTILPGKPVRSIQGKTGAYTQDFFWKTLSQTLRSADVKAPARSVSHTPPSASLPAHVRRSACHLEVGDDLYRVDVLCYGQAGFLDDIPDLPDERRNSHFQFSSGRSPSWLFRRLTVLFRPPGYQTVPAICREKKGRGDNAQVEYLPAVTPGGGGPGVSTGPQCPPGGYRVGVCPG